jgi:nitrate/nitrite-specific signal transduction histidine kinase
MRERAASVGGTLTISTLSGQGTTINVSLPLQYQEMRAEPYVTTASARG